MTPLITYLRTSLSERLLLWSWRVAPKRYHDTAILRRHVNAYFTEVMQHDRP